MAVKEHELIGGPYDSTVVKIVGEPAQWYMPSVAFVGFIEDIKHATIQRRVCTYERKWVGDIIRDKDRETLLREISSRARLYWPMTSEEVASQITVEINLQPWRTDGKYYRCPASTFIYVHSLKCRCGK